MANIKAINQALDKVDNVKDLFMLDFVQERAIQNYKATTGRKDGSNWLHTEALAIINLISQKPDYAKADRLSIWNCLMDAARKGLSIADGHMDLIPYKTQRGNNWVTILKAEPNYKGMRKQLQDMPEIKFIHEAQVVWEGEEFVHDKLNNRIVKHETGNPPDDRSLKGIKAAYVRIEFKDGHTEDIVMYQYELVAAKNKSKNKGEESAWNTFTSEMCKKSVIKRANKIHHRRNLAEIDDQEFKQKVELQPDTIDTPHQEVAQEESPQVEEVEVEEVKETPKKQPTKKKSNSMDQFLSE